MPLHTLLRQFSIRARMHAMIGVTLALLLAVGATGLYGLYQNKSHANEHAEHAFSELSELGQLREAAALLRLEAIQMERQAALGWSDQAARHAQRWMDQVHRLNSTAESMLEGEEDEDNVHARKLLSDLEAHRQAMMTVISALKSAELSADEASMRVAQALNLCDPIQEHLAAISTVMNAEAAEGKAALASNTLLVQGLYGISILVAISIVAVLTWANQRSICEPILAGQAVALAIARGQLDQRIDVNGRDEASALLQALQSMQDGLKSIVHEVREASSAISLASNEIAAGNMDLSGRTETAASNLQQTASSMEQLTQMVRQNADAAQAANDMAQKAAQAAESGNGIMTGVVSSMEDIRRTSQRIHDIIGVIDGIAFQTNILALNAAVEAARAGEQGRGFAVVAGEVRSLAQRSAGAAKEIKHLIEDSGDKISSGSSRVALAGQAMATIIHHVGNVRQTIGDISVTAAEQSSGIGQIGQAVNQLDQMTQQNAALVEESAAASSSLCDQALRLTRTVEAFQI